jgi:hypothetical protein
MMLVKSAAGDKRNTTRSDAMRVILFMIIGLLSSTAINAASLIIYDNALQNGFANNDSWAASYSFSNTSPVHGASGNSISMKPDNWGGVRVKSPSLFMLSDYQNLTFWVNGGSGNGQLLTLILTRGGVNVGSFDIGNNTAGGIAANAWHQTTIDFNAAHLTYGGFDGFTLQSNNSVSGIQPTVFFDDFICNRRSTAIAVGTTVNVAVDTSIEVRAINPLIFGVSAGNAARNQQMGYTLQRWGGNSVTRYNWQAISHNSASDYFYINYNSTQTDSADTFISATHSAGAQALLTIPTIGWTPDSAGKVGWGYSVAKYGAQHATEFTQTGKSWANADAGNGECDTGSNSTGHCVGNHIVGNDPLDTSKAVDANYEAQWIAHLQSTFGTAAADGVKYYALDNEPMLWNSTHRDVHPAAPSYDEIWQKAQQYGAAIKAQDPAAIVTGPVTWGWCDVWSSAADSALGNCYGGPDQNAHGGTPFVQWYLQQVCTHPLASGKRLVDVLDLHYYPQADPGEDDSPSGAALRLRSLKELYNPTWVSDSWIGGTAQPIPNFIPRMRSWIPPACADIGIALTEYNWGPDDTDSGAVAQAEVLGIFAREGVSMAARWIAPAANTKAERGFQIFLNYDGAGSKVSGNSVHALSSNIDQIGSYAFHLPSQRLMILLTNKDSVAHPVSLTLQQPAFGKWKLYGFDSLNALAAQPGGTINGISLSLSALPAMSASLLVLPDGDSIFANGFESH